MVYLFCFLRATMYLRRMLVSYRIYFVLLQFPTSVFNNYSKACKARSLIRGTLSTTFLRCKTLLSFGPRDVPDPGYVTIPYQETYFVFGSRRFIFSPSVTPSVISSGEGSCALRYLTTVRQCLLESHCEILRLVPVSPRPPTMMPLVLRHSPQAFARKPVSTKLAVRY